MKNKKTIFKIGTGIAVAALVVAAVCLGKCRNEKIVIINFDKVKEEAVIFQKVAAEQQKYETFLRTQIMSMDNMLQNDEKELNDRAAKMKTAELNKAKKELQEKQAVLQQRYQAEASKIVEISKLVMYNVNNTLAGVVSDFADQNGYDVILPQTSVIFTSHKQDVTEDFVRVLNDKTASVAYADLLKLPPELQQAAAAAAQANAEKEASTTSQEQVKEPAEKEASAAKEEKAVETKETPAASQTKEK